MSMRAPVDRAKIEAFLRRLGQDVHTPGRILLVGGSALVYEGDRPTTMDIDLVIEASDEGPILAVIRRLKDDMDTNVELASPGDFIPLPTGWRERSVWIGRFGSLDVAYFDLYSIALSKIARANERDLQDVVSLVQSGRIDLAQLDATYQEILPQIGAVGIEGRRRLDPQIFANNYEALRRLLGIADQ